MARKPSSKFERRRSAESAGPNSKESEEQATERSGSIRGPSCMGKSDFLRRFLQLCSEPVVAEEVAIPFVPSVIIVDNCPDRVPSTLKELCARLLNENLPLRHDARKDNER
jgi:hypothetical protein